MGCSDTDKWKEVRAKSKKQKFFCTMSPRGQHIDASSPGDVLDVVRLVEDKHGATDADLPRCADHRVHQVAARNRRGSAKSGKHRQVGSATVRR